VPLQSEVEASKRKLGLTGKMAAVEQFPLPENQASHTARGNIAPADDLGAVPADVPGDYEEGLGAVPVDVPPEPDMTAVRQHFQATLGAKPVTGIMEAIEAGWQSSVSGLFGRGKAPEMKVAPDASAVAKVASGISQFVGDLPAIVPGTIGGAFAGSAVAPGPGTLIGAGAGGNAAPAAIRKLLMDHYEKGDIQNAKDFVDRSMSVLWETSKQAVVGGLTGGAGVVAGKAVAPLTSTLATRLAVPAAEIATMTTAGAAIEGELPDAEDFTVAGLMVATMHGLVKVGTGGGKHVSQKMKKIYAETGIRPEQVANDAKADPILQQELLTDDADLPKAYEAMVEKTEEPAVSMAEVVNEPAPEIAPEHAAVRKILENVEDAPKPTKEGHSFSKLYTDFVDRLNPIKEVVKELGGDNLPTEKNPYNLARLANDFKAKVRHTIERGTIDFKTLEINGKGLNDIVAPFKENLREFEAFLISKRAMDYEARGLNAGFDMDAAREVVKMGEKKYGAAAKELVEFQRRNLQYLADAGIISKDSMKAMVKAGENYIPLKRLLEPEQFETKRTKGGALKRVKGVEEGADIKTRSPILSILENTEMMMKLAEKNRAIESFVRLAEESGAEGVIEKVKAKSRPIQVSAEEIGRFLKENGIEGDAEAFNIFRPNQMQLGVNEFEVIRNGKREVYRTTDELAAAFKSLDGDKASMGVLMKLARGITTVKRIGITLTPDFIVRNFLRDQMTSAATSKGGVVPFTDVIVAMGDLFKKNEHFYNYLKSGGAQGSFLELNERYLMKDVFKLEKSTGMLESTWNVIKKPADALLAAAHIVELAPRLAEFKKVSAGESAGPKVFRGGFAAREVTLDFQRMGARMSAWNSITAFTNATIQGADKTARALREDPKGVAMKGAAYITVPSILLWWANKDDERVKAIPRWEKDLYWIIPTDSWEKASPDDHAEMVPEHLKRIVNGEMLINKGTVYRIPKPHEFGVLFGSLPERILDSMFKDDPRAFKGFGETMLSILSPGVVPDAAAPAIEQWANKSIFTGRKMIPFNLEGVAPEYQFTDYTSESAKQLAKLTSFAAGPKNAASPIVIDNYVRQWSGTLGQYAVALADKFLLQDGGKAKPEASLADIPAIKAFVVRYPGSGAQQISDFYDRKEDIDEKLNTIKLLSKSAGMEEELDRYLESNSSEAMARFSGTAEAISNSRKMIRAIHANPEISPKEKRQLIDGQYFMMIEAARVAMEIADELDKSVAAAKSQIPNR
jgi:hypothetical protein